MTNFYKIETDFLFVTFARCSVAAATAAAVRAGSLEPPSSEVAARCVVVSPTLTSLIFQS
jgi:hypothetical protein